MSNQRSDEERLRAAGWTRCAGDKGWHNPRVTIMCLSTSRAARILDQIEAAEARGYERGLREAALVRKMTPPISQSPYEVEDDR